MGGKLLTDLSKHLTWFHKINRLWKQQGSVQMKNLFVVLVWPLISSSTFLYSFLYLVSSRPLQFATMRGSCQSPAFLCSMSISVSPPTPFISHLLLKLLFFPLLLSETISRASVSHGTKVHMTTGQKITLVSIVVLHSTEKTCTDLVR